MEYRGLGPQTRVGGRCLFPLPEGLFGECRLNTLLENIYANVSKSGVSECLVDAHPRSRNLLVCTNCATWFIFWSALLNVLMNNIGLGWRVSKGQFWRLRFS
jgi:hypothetical protein